MFARLLSIWHGFHRSLSNPCSGVYPGFPTGLQHSSLLLPACKKGWSSGKRSKFDRRPEAVCYKKTRDIIDVSKPILINLSGVNTHKSQLFWCELQGYKVLTQSHFIDMWSHLSPGLPVEKAWFFFLGSLAQLPMQTCLEHRGLQHSSHCRHLRQQNCTRSAVIHAAILKCISGWWFEPLWKILVNWDDYSQYMGKWKCSKPPTRS